MATIALVQGTTGVLSFNNAAVGLDPARVASVTWSLLSTGGGALTFVAPNQLAANAEGVGRVQATVALVNPSGSQLYNCWVEVTPTPAPGSIPLTNPIQVSGTVVITPPAIPASLHRTQPTKAKTNETGTTLEAHGVRFTTQSKIIFDGVEQVTTFVGVEELRCPLPVSATEKVVPVLVRTGTTDTTSVNFEYKN